MKNSKQNDAAREERLQIMLSPEELTAVDDFRFQHRMPSRAAAVRELLRLGLTAASDRVSAAGARSREYGAISAQQVKSGK